MKSSIFRDSHIKFSFKYKIEEIYILFLEIKLKNVRSKLKKIDDIF